MYLNFTKNAGGGGVVFASKINEKSFENEKLHINLCGNKIWMIFRIVITLSCNITTVGEGFNVHIMPCGSNGTTCYIKSYSKEGRMLQEREVYSIGIGRPWFTWM